ncbi:amino acid adenylation domain-containing protein [Kriegella sp. EG-1]|nr:amino acid adenylation domain-containing protein [Flavobacteriaceae bacterium EG-1]
MIKILPHTINFAASAYPEKEAFIYGKESLTYFELNKKTNKLASYLISHGVQKGDRVGVYLFRSIETPIAIYGIMKAGAVFVPIDPELPIARINFILNDCNINYVVTNPNLRKKHPKIIELKNPLKGFIGADLESDFNSITWPALFNTSIEKYSDVSLNEDDLAYIMYTSGSTGFPKGIMHTHKSGLSYARLSVNLFDIDENDRLASHAALHFDISTLGYLAGPLAKATTIIISEAHTKMASSLAALIEQEKITIWYSVPLAIIQLLQSNALNDKNLDSLRLVLFGGEVFANKYLSQIMNLCPNTHFYNIYGPAEVNQCTSYKVNTPPTNETIVPIGTVWEETEYLILDDKGNLNIDGDYGELAIHSSTMMKGYWNNQTLTNKSTYVAIEGEKEKKYFKTGDLVKKNESGDLVFLGRNDRQVKIRGYRIEIDEIEAALLKHKYIIEAAVVVLHKNVNEKEIMAAIILSKEENISLKEIKAHCYDYLPSYAVPESIEFMPDFPRTGSGKIDRIKIMNIYTNA